MISKNSTLSVTFQECGNHLVGRGNYQTAKITVKNAFQFDKKTGESLEIVNVLEPMKVIKEPEFKHATRNIVMSNEFIQMALARPIKPRKGASFAEWTIYDNWNKTSDEDKIAFRLGEFGHDIGCELIDFEIL